MKLLIVDDEELTRVGVISSINWQSIGIDEVLQADDGMNGLEMARMHKPDIILCDVRMPRLDGIQMLEQLETILDKKESDAESTKIGVYNVNERLQLFFGPDAVMKYYSTPGVRTMVMLVLPIVRGKEEDSHAED